MRLSEAIRLGAMLRPQGRGPSAIYPDFADGTCAFGAAAEAAGLHLLGEELALLAIGNRWPFLFNAVSESKLPPAISRRGDTGLDVVWQLNDNHYWTREQIADWVETVEPAEVSSDADASAESVPVFAHTAQK